MNFLLAALTVLRTDQVIEKSKSHRNRVKLLERGKDLTLVQVRTIASTVKLTELHANHMDSESAPSVYRVHGHSGKPKYKAENSKTIGQKSYRCEKSGI